MKLLEQDIIRRRQVDKTIARLEFGSQDGKKYEVKIFYNSTVYARELRDHPPGFYYLVSWKGYLKKENTWEATVTV